MDQRHISEEFSIVFVCTGNRARSPFAEGLMRARLAQAPVTVSSCGTLDLGPMPALPEAVESAVPYGVDLRSAKSCALELHALAHADLVLGFEPAHVAAAVVDGGARRERTFTILELAELLDGLPDAAHDPGHVLELAHRRRASNPLSAPSIEDPLGGTAAVFKDTFDRIDRAVAVIAAALFGAPSPAPVSELPAGGPRAGRVRRLLSGRRRSG